MESKQWQKLEADDLWIKCTFKEDSYSIWLTELCHLYAEELDADDFRWRATKAKIPIDIDEAANLTTVLKTLSQAVNDGRLGLPPSRNKSRHMELNATVHLPKPLPDIDWTFKLELQEDDKFREAVSKPLLLRIDGFEQQEEDLINRLHDKDHAIEKLLDALEKYSVDLADVFPSLASHGAARRTNGRRDAEAHIPALQVFRKEIWQESIANGKRYERPRTAERAESGSFESLAPPAPAKVSNTHGRLTVYTRVDHWQETQAKEKEAPTNGKGASNGIKRTLGGRKAATPAPAASDTESGKATAPDSTPSPAHKPKGIKRTLGGRNADTTVGSTTATDASEPESRPSSAEKPKGIKRTLGGRHVPSRQRHASPSPSAKEQPDDEPPQDNPAQQRRDEEPEDPVDEDEAADRKRAALKRQFAAAAANKPKKRKF